MRKILRCGVLLAAAAVALLMPARAGETLRVGKSSPTSSAIMPIDVGAQMGVFAKHGFEIKIADFSGGSRLFQAMVAGSIDIGISAGPEMALIVKGAPVLAICNMAPPVPFLGIVLPADSPVRAVDDLRGKRIGVASELSLSKWLALELARTRGWGIDGVTTVAVGNAPAAVIAAFRTHSIDADIGSTSFAFNLEAKNEGRLLIPVSDYEGNIAAGTIYATNALIKTNPDAIRRFLAGWLDTIAFMRKNKADTARIESQITGNAPAVQAKDYDLTVGMFSEDCKFDSESLDNLKRSFADLNILPSPPDMTKLYTEAFLPKR